MIAVPALLALSRGQHGRARRIGNALVIFLAPAIALGLIHGVPELDGRALQNPVLWTTPATGAVGPGADPALGASMSGSSALAAEPADRYPMTEPAGTPMIDHAFTGDSRGAAHDPTYAGALSFMRRRYSKDVAGCDLVIWGVPFDLAVSNRPGTRFGPQALRRVSAIFDGDAQYPSRIDPFETLAAVDYGDCLLPRSDLQGCARSIEDHAAAIIATGAHLVTLGGDHFITLPLLRAHVARHGKLALVQFDAHQDTWDDGVGAISHGTFVLEAVREDLIDVERSIQIGIRTVAPRDCGIAVIDAYERPGARRRWRRRRRSGRGSGQGPAYLTFDIDAHRSRPSRPAPARRSPAASTSDAGAAHGLGHPRSRLARHGHRRGLAALRSRRRDRDRRGRRGAALYPGAGAEGRHRRG